MRNVHARSTAVLAAALLVAGASLALAQTVSFSGELTTGTTGWVKQGTSRMNWIGLTPPALSYIAADNIRGSEVGNFTRALPVRFEGKHAWMATINVFNIKTAGTGLTYNYVFVGAIETNGWINSDFAGVRINDNNGTANRSGYAYLRDGANAWSGIRVNIATATDYRIDIGYTNGVVVSTFTRLSDNVKSTSTASATGSPSFSWGSFGFATGGGSNGGDGFSINRVRDISFTGYIPSSSTLILIR